MFSALDILGSRGCHFKKWECMRWGSDPFLRFPVGSHGSTPGGGEGGTGGACGEIVTEPLSPASVGTFSPSPGFEEWLRQFLVVFSEDVFPCVAVDLMCLWEQVYSGSSKVAILN